MSLFSRRSVQKMVNENAKILRKDQLKRHVDNLNRADEQSIHTEWEIVLLYALNKLGNVIHEPDLEGASKVDIHFSLKSDPCQSFIADIATLSDRGYEKENPYEDFSRELTRRVTKYKLNPNYFSLKTEGQFKGSFEKRKMKLKILPKEQFHRFFDEKFKSFIKTIVKKPLIANSFIVKTEPVDVSIVYNPRQKCSIGHHPSYTTAYSLTNNPVYNTLKKKKDQLRGANYNGPMAIFLCDGGCKSLNDRGYARLNCSTDDISRYFLGQTTSISFVLIFVIERPTVYLYLIEKPGVKFKFFENPKASKKLGKELMTCISRLPKIFPKPINDPINAMNRFKSTNKNKGLSGYGGMTVTEKTIKISSRALLELLAGEVKQAKFLKDHHFISTEDRPDNFNIFAKKLTEGKLIKDIRFEKTNEDDDWIIFEFGCPDPAIFPFVVPKDKEDKSSGEI